MVRLFEVILLKNTSLKPLLGLVSKYDHFWDHTGFVVTESDVAGHFESYKARIFNPLCSNSKYV
jgi:hypothetical protein